MLEHVFYEILGPELSLQRGKSSMSLIDFVDELGS